MAIDERIDKLDLQLFSHVHTTTPEDDLRTLLALQSVVRRVFPKYVYLEIGSFQGGSLQPHVGDPACETIFSIDPRPGATADTRGTEHYPASSAQGMLDNLSRVPGANVSKVQTFDLSSSQMTPKSLSARPQWCFVDGEHTDEAALTDARFCLSVLAENGIIAFHDANLVFKGLQNFLSELDADKRPHRAFILPNSVFLVEIGTIHFCDMEPLRGLWAQNYKAYLAGMMANDWYRVAYNLPVYKMLRTIRRLFPRSQ